MRAVAQNGDVWTTQTGQRNVGATVMFRASKGFEFAHGGKVVYIYIHHRLQIFPTCITTMPSHRIFIVVSKNHSIITGM